MRWELFAAGAALFAVLLAGLFIILWATRWRSQPQNPHNAADARAAYRTLFESGEISSEEYARICRQLANPADASPPRDTAE